MAEVNFLSQDVEIKGSIRCLRDLFFDGRLEGNIHSTAALTLGQNAEIKGEIQAKSVTLIGRAIGNISVEERCELKANAQLIGDLHAPRLIIEEGATFVGKSAVSPSNVKGPALENQPTAEGVA